MTKEWLSYLFWILWEVTGDRFDITILVRFALIFSIIWVSFWVEILNASFHSSLYFFSSIFAKYLFSKQGFKMLNLKLYSSIYIYSSCLPKLSNKILWLFILLIVLKSFSLVREILRILLKISEVFIILSGDAVYDHMYKTTRSVIFQLIPCILDFNSIWLLILRRLRLCFIKF